MRKRFCAVVVVIAAALLGCDRISSTHPTRTAAKEAIARGWIPDVLPPSATDIRETHDLDLNTGHGTFAFGRVDAGQFRASLTALTEDQSLRAPGISRERLERRGYSLYRDGDFDIAIDWDRGVGEFWLVYSR